jgi:branched-chain amino acid transport system substrate-binding protein
MVAPPTIALVRAIIEPALRGPGGALGPEEALRVAILRMSNASGTSHSDALISALLKTRDETPGTDEIRHFLVEDTFSAGSSAAVESGAEVVAYAPHLVLDGGGSDAVIAAIEEAGSSGPRPLYIFGGTSPEVIKAITRAQPDFPARFFTIGTRDNPTSDKMQAHVQAVFGGDASELSSTPYDAFYVLAYAAIALGEEPVSGRALARAIRRLVPPGEPVEVGPAGIYPALNVLAAGGTIDLQGTLTSLDFDPVSGDATADFALFCLSADGEAVIESDLHFDPVTAALIGEGGCP